MPQASTTIRGLTRKRAELAGRIKHLRGELDRALLDLDSIDGALRVFDSGIEPDRIRPKRVPKPYAANKGEIVRPVLDSLRTEGPLTRRELALRVMAARGLDPANKQLVTLVIGRVGACLRYQRNRGVVASEERDRKSTLWRLT